MNAEQRQNIYSYIAYSNQIIYMTVMYKLCPCVSQSHCQCQSVSRQPLSKSPLALIHYLLCFTSV